MMIERNSHYSWWSWWIKCPFYQNYQSEMEEIQTNLTDVLAHQLNFDRALFFIARHKTRKFRRYKVGNIVVHLLVTRGFDWYKWGWNRQRKSLTYPKLLQLTHTANTKSQSTVTTWCSAWSGNVEGRETKKIIFMPIKIGKRWLFKWKELVEYLEVGIRKRSCTSRSFYHHQINIHRQRVARRNLSLNKKQKKKA